MKYEKLKKIREKNKYTIKELSNKLNVSEKEIKNWENGTLEPDVKYIKKLCQIYNEPLSTFIDGDKLCSIMNNIEKYKEMQIYSFKGESENFIFDNGTLVLSRDNKYINISDFDIKNDLKLKSVTINIAFNESLWIADEYEEGSLNINDWFKNIKYSEYARNENLVLKKEDKDSFSKYKTNFPYDFKVEVNYCTIDDKCSVEILNITSKKLDTTNKIVR